LLDILKKYDSGSSIKVLDPVSSEEVRKPAKPFMVNASIRLFEQGLIKVSSGDHTLEKQLRNYIVERITPTGTPVYGLQEPKVLDHRLDALNLAIVAFHLEFNDLYKITTVDTIGAALDPRLVNRSDNLQEQASKAEKDGSPETRRIDSKSNLGLFYSTMAGRVDNEPFERKHNRPGWESDTENIEEMRALRQRRSRGRMNSNRPTRTNI
jgi:hypothetical protein